MARKSEKNTVSLRLEVAEDAHTQIKKIKAKKYLDDQEDLSINALAMQLLQIGIESEIKRLNLETK